MNGQGVTHIIHIQIDTIPISAGKKIMRYGHCINAGAYNENGKCLAATVDDARARRAVLLSTLATEEWEAQTDGTVAARWRHDCAEKGDDATKIVEVGCCGNSKVSRRAFQLLYLEFIAAQHSVSHSADFGSKSEQTQISQNFGQVQHTLNALTDIRYSLRT